MTAFIARVTREALLRPQSQRPILAIGRFLIGLLPAPRLRSALVPFLCIVREIAL
ncbi:MAG: hypothetical protein ABL907_02170 [Hyphomicrobium sp.]